MWECLWLNHKIVTRRLCLVLKDVFVVDSTQKNQKIWQHQAHISHMTNVLSGVVSNTGTQVSSILPWLASLVHFTCLWTTGL